MAVDDSELRCAPAAVGRSCPRRRHRFLGIKPASPRGSLSAATFLQHGHGRTPTSDLPIMSALTVESYGSEPGGASQTDSNPMISASVS
jgi:hypothetical protein